MSIQRSLEVETHLSLQSSKSDNGAIKSLKALKNTIINLKLLQDGDTILLPQRIHLHHHDGNHAATCGERGTGIHGNLHPGVNSDFLLESFQMSDFYFACRQLKKLAIDGRCKQYTYRAHVFLMHSLSLCLLQLVVTVVQSSCH